MKVLGSSKHWVPIAGVDGRNGEFKWGFGMCWASSVVKLSMLDVWVWAGNGSSNRYQGIESMERLQSYTVIFLCRWALTELLLLLFVSNSFMLCQDQIAFSSLSLLSCSHLTHLFQWLLQHETEILWQCWWWW
jgi:hypothetical protein